MTTPSSPASGGNSAGRQLDSNDTLRRRYQARRQRLADHFARHQQPTPEPTVWDIPAPPAWEDLQLDQQAAIRERFKLAALAMAIRQLADQRQQSPASLLADWEVL